MSLNLIEEAIEKVGYSNAANRRELAKHGLTQKKIDDKSEKLKGTAIAGVGAGAGVGASHLIRNKSAKDTASFSDLLTKNIGKAFGGSGKGMSSEALKDIKDVNNKGIGSLKVRDILKSKDSAILKLHTLAMKKRVMAPVGAALAGGAYLASRKDKK